MEQGKIIFQTFHSQIYRPEFIDGLTIFFGLAGNSTVRYRSVEYPMTAGAVLAVNPFELYQAECPEQAEMICMQIPEHVLRLGGWNAQTACFCYGSGINQQQDYQEIRVLFATIFQDFFQDKERNASAIASRALQLVNILATRFPFSDAGKGGTKQEETMRRVKRIIDYIHANWNENISLQELAKREYLSEGYLSRFFRKNLDMTYSQYVIRLRLNHAARQLQDTSHSVTRVAYDCGFRNVSTFIESFRQCYGMTPGRYRKQLVPEPPAGNQEQAAEALQNGFAYLLQYAEPLRPQQETAYRIRQISVSGQEKPVPLRHTWKNLLNVGYAKYLLTAEVQQQIIRAQREIGFRYVRFHGILDDTMHIYQGKQADGIACNFTFLDMVLDFLLAQGLLPFLEFSFVPRALAKANQSIFESGSVTAACADCETFGKLIQAILRHTIDRYGWKEVSRWKFTTLQINYVFFGCMTLEEYLELYETAYRAVKRTDARFVFGGPGAMASVVRDERGLRAFLRYAQEHDCLPDFYTVQSYPHEAVTVDAEFMDYTLSQQSIPSVLSKDPDFVASFLKSLRVLLKEFDLSDPEIHLEEWNSTLWQRDLSSDTCYKSVWMVKNTCENMDAAESFGYWTFSDFMDERSDFHSIYHGGYGLMTYNGIPKSGYEALRLLARLGNERMARGDGWYLTRSAESWQLILYNYVHYGNIYRYRYQRLEHPQDAYSVFEPGETLRLQIHLAWLPSGTYEIEEQEISRTVGSSFDCWLESGAEESPTPARCRYFREHAAAGSRICRLEAVDGLRLETELKPLEVKLLVIRMCENK